MPGINSLFTWYVYILSNPQPHTIISVANAVVNYDLYEVSCDAR